MDTTIQWTTTTQIPQKGGKKTCSCIEDEMKKLSTTIGPGRSELEEGIGGVNRRNRISRTFSGGRTPPEPSTGKHIPHLLLQLHRLLVQLFRFLPLYVRQGVLAAYRVNRNLDLVAPALAAPQPLRQNSLADHPAPPLVPQGSPAQPRRHLECEHEQTDEPAGAAAAHDGALHRGDSHHLAQPGAPGGGGMGSEQVLAAVGGCLLEFDLPGPRHRKGEPKKKSDKLRIWRAKFSGAGQKK